MFANLANDLWHHLVYNPFATACRGFQSSHSCDRALYAKNVASWEIPKLNEVVHGTIIELNGGFSSLPCLITRGTHTFYIANPARDGVWENVFRKLRFFFAKRKFFVLVPVICFPQPVQWLLREIPIVSTSGGDFATITMWNPEDRSDGLWLGLPCFMMDISTLFYVYSRSVKFTWLQGGGPQAMYVGSWWLFIMVYDHPHKTSDSYTPKHSDDSSTWMNFWDKPTYSHLHVGPGIQKTPTFPMYFWKPAWVRSSAVEPSEFWYNQQYFCGDTPQLQLHAANPPQEQAIPISISMNIPSFPLISHVFMIFYATFLSIKPLKSRPWHDTPTIPLNGSSTSPR